MIQTLACVAATVLELHFMEMPLTVSVNYQIIFLLTNEECITDDAFGLNVGVYFLIL